MKRHLIELRPITRDEANRKVAEWHRHHKPVRGLRFAIGAMVADELAGVVIVGRPVAQALDDGYTFEVTRLATPEGAAFNVASRLLGAAWRAARAMGVRRMVSYTRADEAGTCYLAAGWVQTATVRADTWHRRRKAGTAGSMQYIPGLFEPTTEPVPRVRWELSA